MKRVGNLYLVEREPWPMRRGWLHVAVLGGFALIAGAGIVAVLLRWWR